MQEEKDNLILNYELSNDSIFLNDIITCTCQVINTGTYVKNNTYIEVYIPPFLEYIPNSLTVDGRASTFDISNSIELGTLNVDQEINVSYKLKAIKKCAYIPTNFNIKCDFEESSSTQNIFKTSDTKYITIYDKRILIDTNQKLDNCKVGNTNTFYIKILNLDVSQDLTSANISVILSENYTFEENSIVINGIPYVGTLNSINIAALKGNVWNTIEFTATAIKRGSTELNAIVTYNRESLSKTIKETAQAFTLQGNTYENDNDNVTLTLKLTPCYTDKIQNLSAEITIKNNGDSDIKNVFVQQTLTPNFKMKENSLYINGVKSNGNIDTGVTIETIVSTTSTKVTFEIEPLVTITNHKTLATLSYFYKPDASKESYLDGSKISNAEYINIGISPLLWNITTAKDKYTPKELINFDINIINNHSSPMENMKINITLPNEIEYVEDSLKLDNVSKKWSSDFIELSEEFESNSLHTLSFLGMAQATNPSATVSSTIEYDCNDGNIVQNSSKELALQLEEPITPALELDVEVSNRNYMVNSKGSMYIVISNMGNVDLNRVTISDILDSALEYLPNTLKVNSSRLDSTPDNIPIGTLRVNERKEITLDFRTISVKKNIKNHASSKSDYIDEEGAIHTYTFDSPEITLNVYDTLSALAVVTKEANSNAFMIGQEVTYLLKVKNLSNITLEDTYLTDQIGEGLEYVPYSTTINNEITSDIMQGIHINEVYPDYTYQVQFKAIAREAKQNVTNQAKFTSSYINSAGRYITYDALSNTVAINLLESLEFSGNISEQVSKHNIMGDEKITVAITLNNTSPLDYTNVTLKVPFDSSQFILDDKFELNGKKAKGDIQSGVDIGKVKANSSTTLSFILTAINNSFSATLQATATISYFDQTTKTQILTSNLENIQVTAKTGALNILKTSSLLSAKLNDTVNLKLIIANSTNSDIKNLTIIDMIPDSLEFVPNTLRINDTASNLKLEDGINIDNVLANSTQTISFDAKITALKESIRNQAIGIFPQLDTQDKIQVIDKSSNVLDLEVTELGAAYILTNISSDKKSYNINDTATFKTDIKNLGVLNVSKAILIFSLAPNYSVVAGSIKTNGKSYTGDIKTGIEILDISPNEVVTVEFNATAQTPALGITGRGIVTYEYKNGEQEIKETTSEEYLTNILDDTGLVLNVTKSANYSKLALRDIVNITVNISNTSEELIKNVTFKDTLDTTLAFVSGSLRINGTLSLQEPTDEISLPDINPASSLSVSYLAIANKAGIYSESAAVSFDSVADKKTTLSNSLKLDISEEESSLNLIASSEFTNTFLNEGNNFNILIRNNSATTAKNIRLNIYLDSVYSFSSNHIKINNNIYDLTSLKNISLPDINANKSIVISFEATGNALKDNAIITSSVTYETDNISKNSYSNLLLTNVTVKKQAMLTVTKEEEFSTLNLNDTNKVTISIKNTGNANVYNCIIQDVLDEAYTEVPNSLKINNMDTAESITKQVRIANIAPDETVTITFLEKAMKEKSNIQNQVNIEYSYLDANDNEETNSVSSNVSVTNIVIAKSALLNITKKAAKDVLTIDEENTFTIVVENTGNEIATDITVTDELPNNYELVPNSTIYNGSNENSIIDGIKIQSLAPNSSISIEFKAIALNMGNDIENTARVSYSYIDESSQLKNITKQSPACKTTIVLQQAANLVINKNVIPGIVYTEDTVSYVFTIRNTGTVKAENIVLTDRLPINLKYLDNSLKINDNIAVGNDPTLINLPDLESGETVTVSFNCIAVLESNEITNMAEVKYEYTFLNKTNVIKDLSNEEFLTIVKRETEDITITHSVNFDTLPLFGENIFNFEIINNSALNIKNVTLLDFLPDNYMLLDDTIKIQEDNINYRLENGNILIEQIWAKSSIHLTFNAIATIPDSNIISMALLVAEVEPYPNFIRQIGVSSNSIFTNILAEDSANIVIKRKVPQLALVNVPIQFHITLTNIGDIPAKNIYVSDILDTAFIYDKDSLIINGVKSTENILNGFTLANLLPSEEVSITYTVIPVKEEPSAITDTEIEFEYLTTAKVEINKKTSSQNIIEIIGESGPNIVIQHYSNSTQYYTDEVIEYGVLIQNKSNILLENCTLYIDTDNLISYIPNSVEINGNPSTSNIDDGIDLQELSTNDVILVTFKAIAKEKGNNVSKAKLEYSYNLVSSQIDENIYSNEFSINIVQKSDIELYVFKNTEKLAIIKDTENTFTIQLENVGKTNLINLLVTDVLDNAYEYVPNSLSINNVPIASDIRAIKIESLEPNETKTIQFKVKGIKSKKTINNIATIYFEYIEDNKMYSSNINTNLVTTRVMCLPNGTVKELLTNLADLENSIYILISKEENKIKYSLDNIDSFEDILRINDSISSLIQSVIVSERIALDELNMIIDNI